MRHRLLWLSISIPLGALIAAGCGGKQPATERPGTMITLSGAGASFPYPLYSKWIHEYQKHHADVRINYQSIGSGGGIEQLKARTVDFGASDAPLSDEDAKAMPGEVVHLPTVAGAVAVVYNLPALKKPLRLDAGTLTAIYLGEVKRWNEKRIATLNPGVRLPGLAIAVAHRSDGSGTTNIFTDYLSSVSKTWAERVGKGKSVDWPTGIGAKGNEGVAGVVQQTPGGIGYVELAYAIQNDLATAEMENAAGVFVAPTLESTTAAAAGAVAAMKKNNDVRVSIVNSRDLNAYPIAGFTYILVYRDQKDRAKSDALFGFLHWAIHDGQRFAASLHYAPLPDEVVTINEQALRNAEFSGRTLSD
jgi:phosphate transport system substrate-binding protein